MKKLALTVVIFCLANTSFAQKKLIERIFSNEKDTTRKASFMPIPVFGYAQETGFEFGLGSIYSFYVDKADTNNRSSNFFGAASYSTKKTYNVTLRGDAWTKRNDYHFIGEIRFRNMPFNFYGIGNNTSHIDEDKLVQRMVKVQFDAEKAFAKNTYTGVSIGFENYKFTDQEVGGVFNNSLRDKDGGSVLFVGLSQSYDTRNSNNYPTKGFFGRISYQYAPAIFGGNNFTGSQIKVNVRNFWSLAPKIVLGVQGLYHTVQSSNTSFYLLPQMGNDEMMRGYYGGRYRDENLLAAQAEIRYRFMERLGMIVFGGAGKVFANEETQLLKNFKPNYGIGGRYFFDPAKGLSVRLDYGIGEKRTNEKRQSGFYISFAEAF
ncbi:BamA/TamA family outer membrane protein [Pedobacter xixiisoli]|uniref:Surface antigen n=1 Tax=Pedobacter xixiisoli TaxID=1476464 RepID=A0A286A7K9_9SPHI|nr:BamA/TamA family outer membrane protein [Pedobacter xixiisoli]SOD17900.1 Surface antigen [Pedobacter xixiisoli]